MIQMCTFRCMQENVIMVLTIINQYKPINQKMVLIKYSRQLSVLTVVT